MTTAQKLEEIRALVKRKRAFRRLSPEHSAKIANALKGKRRSPEHCKNISKARKLYLSTHPHPSFSGDKVGYNGMHSWLRRNFELPLNCEICGTARVHNHNSIHKWNMVWAKKIGLPYARRRENFLGLCYKCHRNYDKTDAWNNQISVGKMGKSINRINLVVSDETRRKISLAKLGKKRPDVALRNKLLKTKKV